MKLNADIGESYGHWRLGDDALIMPLIDQANIACGAHAGDPLVMQQTISLAKTHGVSIGAHVSYPDIQGFGRRSMAMSGPELIAFVHAQIAMLDGMAMCQEVPVSYVKPHGALYNDMMKDEFVFTSIVSALSTYHKPLPLVAQALLDNTSHKAIAAKYEVALRFEGFADRAYTSNGLLVPRNQPNAVLTEADALEQVELMLGTTNQSSPGNVSTIEGKSIALDIDTLCVHGDNLAALALCQKIRQLIDTHTP